MPWCPKCGYEYVDGIQTCSDCLVPLVDHQPTSTGEGEDWEGQHTELLMGVSSYSEAEEITAILKGKGIPVLRTGQAERTKSALRRGEAPPATLELYIPSLMMATALRTLEGTGVLQSDSVPERIYPTHLVSAMGFVFDDCDNVLLGKHPRRGWEFTGGQVENGENLEEGVLREILEESGITASMRHLVGIYSNVAPMPPCEEGMVDIPTMVLFDFVCDYRSGEPTPSDEALEVMWVPSEMVLDYVENPITRLRYKNMLAYNGRVKYCAFSRDPDFRVLYERFV